MQFEKIMKVNLTPVQCLPSDATTPPHLRATHCQKIELESYHLNYFFLK